MGFVDRLPLMTAKHRIDLTPMGRQKLETQNIDGAKGTIMWHLKEHGASSLKEISEYTGMTFPRVKGIAKELAGNDYKWVEWV